MNSISEWRWIEISPMRDGSGVIEFNGKRLNVVVQDLVTTKHRVAFADGKEVARASNFHVLIRRLTESGVGGAA